MQYGVVFFDLLNAVLWSHCHRSTQVGAYQELSCRWTEREIQLDALQSDLRAAMLFHEFVPVIIKQHATI